MSQRKVSTQRFSSAFDLCTNNTDSAESDFTSRKRTRAGGCNIKKKRAFSHVHHVGRTSGDSLTLIEKYAPQTKDDLAVHKKKVCEVEEWLIDSLKKSDSNEGSSILLLSGPPGVGKTATVHALSKDLNIELKEWTNSTHKNWNANDFMGTVSGFAYESQASVFRNFLLRASKYPPLFSFGAGRIVLVEEFPNTFLKGESAVFHEILRKFHRVGRCPLVFIVSDCTTGESVEQSLFPKDLQNDLSVRHISFNPVAPTLLLKVLNKINMECKDTSHKKLSKTELETIASECMGDIRNAVNMLQFLSAPKGVEKTECAGKAPSLTKRKLRSSESVNVNTGFDGKRDASLFLFHALGKILYCKRDKAKRAEDYPLPSHLNHLSRAPLLENPEDVYDKASISEQSFILFLQQNYLSFVEDIKVAAECSSWLSHSETLTAEWAERQTMNFYATSLASRGLMFNLTPCSSGNRWRPLHKPQYFSSTKNNSHLSQSVRYAFKDKQLSLRELEVEFIPYMAKITKSFQNNEIKQLVNQMGTLQSQSMHRLQCDSLCEKEVCEVALNDFEYRHEVEKDHDKTDGNETMSEPCMQNISDEEFIIEECDI